jgi:sugar phosphate isomerase/epimerase
MMEYGLQMYSVRDITKDNLIDALRQVAELGYSFVEFAGFFGNSAKDVKAALDTYGLRVSGTHTGWVELTPERIDETIAYHKELGNTNIIIPSYDMSTKENLEKAIALINEAQPKLAAEGIALGYHNHDYEFRTASYGLVPHEELEKHTNVEFEIDTFWAYFAGKDPVEVLDRLKNRIRVIHLKDGLMDRSGRSLGEGTAPVAAVREYAIKNGMRMVVESEGLQPTGLEEVGRCIRYLRGLDG